MSGRTVEWATARSPRPEVEAAEGLRERKKRLLRQQLSDTATELFLERGFDEVRVAEIATRCGVSEKTVYNYFPTKEALLLDRWDATRSAIRRDLSNPLVEPIEAALKILSEELLALVTWLSEQDDLAAASSSIQRFGELVSSTASLRSHQRDATDQLVAVAAEVLAERMKLKRDAPEPWIAAIALLGLWQTQSQSLRKHLPGMRTPTRLRRLVDGDVERAARVLESGLRSLDASGH